LKEENIYYILIILKENYIDRNLNTKMYSIKNFIKFALLNDLK